jgi:glycosyltransferase involved in cell wall biosynthesis
MTVRVAIDARLEDGRAGGVQQGVESLFDALAVSSGDEAASAVTLRGLDGWLRPHLAPDVEVHEVDAGARRNATRRLRSTRLGRVAIGVGRELYRALARPERSTGVFEATGADVVHFPTQHAELVDRPFVYQPWDLQHRWLPELFSRAERRRRDRMYGRYCRSAAAVVVATEFIRADVVEAYGLDPRRVVVIPPGAPRREASTGSAPLGERTYALYPAQAWAHKNHTGLLDALALLRDDGLDVALVCPGVSGEPLERLRAEAAARHLEGAVRWPGYVDDAALASLYAGARCLVFPSRFEGWGFPVVEAMVAEVPVLCSDAPCLDGAAAGAAVRVDVDDPVAIAEAWRRLWTDDALRADLVSCGRARVAELDAVVVGDAYRALYRRVAAGLPPDGPSSSAPRPAPEVV